MSAKVLLVDDEKDFLDIMAERMTAQGMDVSTATSAEDALEMVSKESYDAVIMDCCFPQKIVASLTSIPDVKSAVTAICIFVATVCTNVANILPSNLCAMRLTVHPRTTKMLCQKESNQNQ